MFCIKRMTSAVARHLKRFAIFPYGITVGSLIIAAPILWVALPSDENEPELPVEWQTLIDKHDLPVRSIFEAGEGLKGLILSDGVHHEVAYIVESANVLVLGELVSEAGVPLTPIFVDRYLQHIERAVTIDKEK